MDPCMATGPATSSASPPIRAAGGTRDPCGCWTHHRLIEALHERGIRIVLDILCNHSSPELNSSKGVMLDDGKLLADVGNDIKNLYHHYPEIAEWYDEFQLTKLRS